jgi:hypothetical protein
MSTSYKIEMLNGDAAMDHLDSENPVSNTAKSAEELEKDERELEKNEGAYMDLRFVKRIHIAEYSTRAIQESHHCISRNPTLTSLFQILDVIRNL